MNKYISDKLSFLEKSQSINTNVNILFDGLNFEILSNVKKDKYVVYKANPTANKFHSDTSQVRLIKGPYGSGKTSMCCAEIVRKTCEMKPWSNGIRRSKWAIVRNTTGELVTTTLQTWLSWFEDLGSISKRQKPVMTYEHVFKDQYGIIEIELIFLALDREDDLRKVRSLEVTGVYINELSEVPRGTISHFMGRLRYPSKDYYEGCWRGIICDTNPPDSDHWIYKIFEEDCPDTYKVFHQPPGLLLGENNEPVIEEGQYIENMESDNYAHLEKGYYNNLAKGQNMEFIKVFCLGQYGSVIMGKRVYPDYNDDFHSETEVQILKSYPIHIGLDFGLTPSAVFVQLTDRGQLRVFKEFIAEDMGIRQFTESVLLPYISNNLKEMSIDFVRGDPSGSFRSETDESTCISILNEYGIKAQGASTNVIVKRIESVKYFLNRMIDGKPALIICRKNCHKLRKGFLGDYHYKRIAVSGEEKFQDKPNKNMSSHPHDALQYICMEFCDMKLKEKSISNSESQKEKIFNPSFRYL